MLRKSYRGDGKVEVTFRMPPLDGVVELDLRGDFNNWALEGVPLSLDSDGTWVASVILDSGRSYRFRYYDNQGNWHNDWEADAYVPNEYGSDDSVVDLTAVVHSSTPRGKAANRTADAAASGNGSRQRRKAVTRSHTKAQR